MNATIDAPLPPVANELPIRVREAAVFLGVSPGRNIRFLKSELDSFRAQFKQEVENWQGQ
jgi:hypothetical protein